MAEKVDGDLIRGNIDTILLGVLLAKDHYGYEMIKAVREKSRGAYELKEPTLYASLRRLEAQGLVTSYWGDASQGARRKYYRITPAGVEQYRKALAEWQRARALIDLLITVEPKEGAR